MWNFKKIEPGIPERNPRETEFFRLRSPAEAVVREFIQNSLDAKGNSQQITAKIAFREIPRKEDVTRFLDDTLKDHLIACGFLDNNGYPETVRCLILEDYGTTGLDGPYNPDAGGENFYNFWWREGISEKTAQKGGRWGLGKITFHIVSKIRTFWGLTVRNDRRMLLMGKALLKTHTFNNQRYHYFGYFSKNDFMPVEDDSIISVFKDNFGISRNNTETGLSIVIPLPVDEINFELLLRSVIQHYFYPILAGSLKVEVHGDHRQEELNNSNLIKKVSAIDWSDTEWKGMNIREILECIRNAIPVEPLILQVRDTGNPEITEQSFGNELDQLKQKFRSGNLCKFKVPVTISIPRGTSRNTSFTIIMKRNPLLRKPFECYIRSGILVSEISTLGNRPVVALLVAEDNPVCEFLGDCETPAHTNWNERTEGFAEKYINAARILRFIKKSMGLIISILDEPPRERQVDFLKEIFSVPISPEEREEEEETTRTPVIPPVERRPRVFNISPIQKGFSVTLNPQITALTFPFHATVRIAYDTRRGNPFARYENFDFDVASSSINITAQDCNVLSRSLNRLEIEVRGQNFRLEVTGFDPNRDLVVDIK